jgi:hypothetical protein
VGQAFQGPERGQESWALAAGFHEIVVKTKNRFYGMRATLTNLQYDVVKHEPFPADNSEAKVYLSKQLGADVLRAHRSRRTVVQVG